MYIYIYISICIIQYRTRWAVHSDRCFIAAAKHFKKANGSYRRLNIFSERFTAASTLDIPQPCREQFVVYFSPEISSPPNETQHHVGNWISGLLFFVGSIFVWGVFNIVLSWSYLVYYYGICIVSLWYHHGITMVLSWWYHYSLWYSYGIMMVL